MPIKTGSDAVLRIRPRGARNERRPIEPPNQYTHLLPWIRGLTPTMKGAPRRIADALLADPEQFIVSSIAELAVDCGVSTASIVLFCKSLGLKGLPMLKLSLARELASPVLPFGEPKDQRGAVSVLQRIFREDVQSLQETLRLNSEKAFSAAVRGLAGARRIVLFSIGLSYSVAYSLYIRLRFMGLPAFIESDSHLQLAAAAEIRPGDVAVAISLSGTTSETVECLRLSRARGAKTLCMTNSIQSPLARTADIRFYAAPGEVRYFQAPLASRVTQLALADAIVAALGQKHRRRALAHLQRAEEHLLKRRLVSR